MVVREKNVKLIFLFVFGILNNSKLSKIPNQELFLRINLSRFIIGSPFEI